MRPTLDPVAISDPDERQSQQATWLTNRASRSHRTRIAGRWAIAASVTAMVLALFFASITSSNPLERAQTIPVTEAVQLPPTDELAHLEIGYATPLQAEPSRLYRP